MNVATIQGALENWVQSVLTLPESNLLWANQVAPEPASGPWVSLRISELVSASPIDTTTAEYDEDGDAGEEVVLTTGGLRSLTFALQAFSRGIVAGNSSAFALLSNLFTKARTESSRTAFDVAGLALYRLGSVQDLSGLNAQRSEGRALLELFFYVVDTTEETTTYIETVEGALAAEGATVPIQANVWAPP